MGDASTDAQNLRLERLLGYLAADPDNAALLVDAAAAALNEGQPQIARDLLARRAALGTFSEGELNLAGLAALQNGAFEEAHDAFARLLDAHPEDPALRFNLAWALAMLKSFPEALALLDEHATTALGQAAALEIQLLHDAGDFDRAQLRAKDHLAHHPDHPGLMAAISVLAVDIEDLALAEACARKGGDLPEALTTLGTLALGDARDAEAAALFQRALQRDPHSPRAWVGKGLTELVDGAYADAAQHIRHGAELFDSHVGSWIAAGWAYLLAQDLTKAREAFERAVELDHNFAESHGSLAVISILEGRADESQRLGSTALRLDRQCFSAALAQSLVLQSQGKPDLARRIIDRALHTSIDGSGATIADAIARRTLFA